MSFFEGDLDITGGEAALDCLEDFSFLLDFADGLGGTGVNFSGFYCTLLDLPLGSITIGTGLAGEGVRTALTAEALTGEIDFLAEGLAEVLAGVFLGTDLIGEAFTGEGDSAFKVAPLDDLLSGCAF